MTWLKNCWQAAAFSHEVNQEILARTFLDDPVVLFRTADGKVAALEDRCAHRSLPLSLGRLVGDTIECGYHGMRYDARGRCVGVPGQDTIPAGAVARTYPILEKYAVVWIWLGDPAKADPALLPDTRWFADPAWATITNYIHIDADYRLINDNLLDLSHESFVHTETLGNRAVADAPVTAAIVDDRYVKVYRYMADCDPPPYYVKGSGWSTRIDRWHTTYFTPPGTIIIESGSMPVGADRAAARQRRILNLITPETQASTHYFLGVARKYDIDDTNLSAYLVRENYKNLEQDRAVLEAQQRALGADPDKAFPVVIKVDAGPIQGRRLLQLMLERDQRGEVVLPVSVPLDDLSSRA